MASLQLPVNYPQLPALLIGNVVTQRISVLPRNPGVQTSKSRDEAVWVLPLDFHDVNVHSDWVITSKVSV